MRPIGDISVPMDMTATQNENVVIHPGIVGEKIVPRNLLTVILSIKRHIWEIIPKLKRCSLFVSGISGDVFAPKRKSLYLNNDAAWSYSLFVKPLLVPCAPYDVSCSLQDGQTSACLLHDPRQLRNNSQRCFIYGYLTLQTKSSPRADEQGAILRFGSNVGPCI